MKHLYIAALAIKRMAVVLWKVNLAEEFDPLAIYSAQEAFLYTKEVSSMQALRIECLLTCYNMTRSSASQYSREG